MIEFEVVKIFYLETLLSSDPNEEEILLQLEILLHLTEGYYTPRLYRLETYKLQAEFGTQEVWGKRIFVKDIHSYWDEVRCASVDEVLREVRKRLPFPGSAD